MQEINQDNELKLTKDPSAETNARKKAQEFLDMAEQLAEQGSVDVKPNKPEIQSTSIDDVHRQLKESKSPKMGPKFLEALTSITDLADIHAVELELPLLRTKVEVTPLTGEEELALKTAAVTPESFLNKLDELIFKHSSFKGIEFENYLDFLENIYPPDKSMLVWGLLNATYMILPSMEITCNSCGENNIVEAAPAEMLHTDTIKNLWDNPLHPREYIAVQKLLDGKLVFSLSMPSERKRLEISKIITAADAKKNVQQNNNFANYMDNILFFIVSVAVGEGKDAIIMTDIIQDIKPFLKNLPPKISDVIKNELDLMIFDEYLPNFYITTKCKHCGAEEDISVDPELTFFRKSLSV